MVLFQQITNTHRYFFSHLIFRPRDLIPVRVKSLDIFARLLVAALYLLGSALRPLLAGGVVLALGRLLLLKMFLHLSIRYLPTLYIESKLSQKELKRYRKINHSSSFHF